MNRSGDTHPCSVPGWRGTEPCLGLAGSTGEAAVGCGSSSDTQTLGGWDWGGLKKGLFPYFSFRRDPFPWKGQTRGQRTCPRSECCSSAVWSSSCSQQKLELLRVGRQLCPIPRARRGDRGRL